MRIAVAKAFAQTRSLPRQHRPLSLKTLVLGAGVGLACLSPLSFAQNALSPAYLTGTWKENAQCMGGDAAVFFPNNTVLFPGSVPVNYAVTGSAQFTMYVPGGAAAAVQAQYLNQNQMLVTHLNNSTVFYRCSAGNAQAGQSAQLSAAYIVGGWTHNGNCATPEVFQQGGYFKSSLNSTGSWALAGNVLQLRPNNGSNADFFIQVNGPQNMTLTQSSNGQVSVYTRCY